MTREFLYGLLAGAVLGAAAGLALAPSRGSDTRRRISEASMPARERMGGIASGVKSRVRIRSEIRQSI